MSWILILALTVLLISINALYVAAEFSTISARRSRVLQLAEGGNPLAQSLLPIVQDAGLLDRYIATCQLGITISSLMLGFFGQSTVAEAIQPLFIRLGGLSTAAAQSISATAILLLFTLLQALLGELVPKNIGIQYPVQLALVTAAPTRWSMALFRPLIWFFNGSGQLLMRLLGLRISTEHVHVHAPEEILMLVEESEAGGLLDREERRLLKNTLLLRETTVRQVMVPRTRLLALPLDTNSDQALGQLAESSFSRLLLYEDSVDDIVGVVHLKDLLCLRHLTGQTDLRAVMRPVLYVPESTPVVQVMAELQRDQYYLAVVLDEYGGTAGMITLKDLAEEIFGEFQDEFDTAGPVFRLLPERRLQVRGEVLVRELNDWLDILLPLSVADTLGGLVLSVSGRVPEVGDVIRVAGVDLRVDEMDGQGVGRVSLAVSAAQLRGLKERRP